MLVERRPTTARGAPRTYLPPGWPLYALFLGFPVWWLLGLGALIWPMLAAPMLLWLLRRQRVVAPRGFAIWLAFLAWMLASATQLDEPDRWIAFGYRAALYLSASIAFLYVFNLSPERLPTRRVVGTLGIFWMMIVIGGLLGTLFPSFSLRSPLESLMPKRLLANDFVYSLVHPVFAQVQTFLGYPVARPAAPFVYTNEWGANFALLTPFVILAWIWARNRAWKVLTMCMALIAIVPVVVSLNRVLWVSLGIGLVYAAIRLAAAGRGRAPAGIVALFVAATTVVALSPLYQLLEDRLANPHSNERRIALYQETTERVLDSPLLGYGSPRPSEVNPNAPSAGTQGQLWLVLFSHGIMGAALFLMWMTYALWKTRRVGNEVAFWSHVVLLIAFVQLPFYGQLPAQLHVIMIGTALALRELLTPQGPLAVERDLPSPAALLAPRGTR